MNQWEVKPESSAKATILSRLEITVLYLEPTRPFIEVFIQFMCQNLQNKGHLGSMVGFVFLFWVTVFFYSSLSLYRYTYIYKYIHIRTDKQFNYKYVYIYKLTPTIIIIYFT
jgi:hypothetical protein